jgi:NTE family protein
MSTSQFRNLVFEGGGVKAIAYMGAMQILHEKGHLDHISRVGGTSAGAINALIFALGYTIDEQREIITSTSFRDFMDNSFSFVRNFRRLWREFGWNKGDFFLEWCGALVERKLGSKLATFGDLKTAGMPDLYVIGTNLSTGFSEVFSHERHSDMSLVDAVRISMSIPLFFAARRYGQTNDVYVDGGVMLNYPVKLFDRAKYIDTSELKAVARYTDYYDRENKQFLEKYPGRSPYLYNRQTLGLRLDKQEEIGLYRYNEPVKGRPIRTFPQFAKALITALLQVQQNMHLHSDDWQRTLYINTLTVGATDFNLTEETKNALFDQGVKGALVYFNWFDSGNSVNQIQSP